MARRINLCIGLLQAGHPIYYTHADELSYENGRQRAQTWADFLIVDFEHAPFDVAGLLAFSAPASIMERRHFVPDSVNSQKKRFLSL